MANETTVTVRAVLKTVEAVLLAVGPAVTAYFLFGFSVDKFGYYYKDTELGIAFGVLLMSSAYAIRYWRR
jgi:hypothetical protein